MIVELFYVSPYVLKIDTFFAHSLCLMAEQNAGAGDPPKSTVGNGSTRDASMDSISEPLFLPIVAEHIV
jgi:hypothetical protein